MMKNITKTNLLSCSLQLLLQLGQLQTTTLELLDIRLHQDGCKSIKGAHRNKGCMQQQRSTAKQYRTCFFFGNRGPKSSKACKDVAHEHHYQLPCNKTVLTKSLERYLQRLITCNFYFCSLPSTVIGQTMVSILAALPLRKVFVSIVNYQ